LKNNIESRKLISTGVLPKMVKQTKLVPAARPFLKKAGGKTQLLNEFSKRLPGDLKKGKITRYVEPFIGAIFV